ncbi:MAG: hypothetical protein NTV61_10770 [Candidatus Bathyarchaeota archaeon]|nr:hypothetical protein [Candidatus Bathyarchaeota archaeon]
MIKNAESISSVIQYIKNLEEEIRDVRQRLDGLERTISVNEWRGTPSTLIDDHIQKIEPITKSLVKTIESAKDEKSDPLKLLTVYEVPKKIIEIKMVLDQLGY